MIAIKVMGSSFLVDFVSTSGDSNDSVSVVKSSSNFFFTADSGVLFCRDKVDSADFFRLDFPRNNPLADATGVDADRLSQCGGSVVFFVAGDFALVHLGRITRPLFLVKLRPMPPEVG